MKRYFRPFITPIRFLFVMIKIKFLLNKLDQSCVYSGKMATNGFYQDILDKSVIDHLIRIYKEYKDRNITFEYDKDKLAVEKIFNLAKPIIRDYLGEKSYLDGIYFNETEINLNNDKIIKSREKYFAESWHTDNVGSRIKCLICIEGDGSQPTCVQRTNDNGTSWKSWFKSIFIESLRWSGFKTKFNLKNTEIIKHKTGTISFLDTNLLHRGAYEIGSKKRVLLILEFSNPEKHKKLNGPIGTNQKNSFYFDDKLYEIDSFKKLLDIQRCKKKDKEQILYLN